MSVWALVGWVLFAAVAAIIHEIIVGLAAMHSGWFPAFAVTLIFLIIGMLVGIPMIPLTMLVGYCSATGPAFADMGYDLKAGWILRRGESPYTRYELDGRKQQFIASLVGFFVAIAMVALLWESFLAEGQIPPVSQIFADTITAGLDDASVWLSLLIWAVPGALIQLFGGAKRQMGVLLATGLLITTPGPGGSFSSPSQYASYGRACAGRRARTRSSSSAPASSPATRSGVLPRSSSEAPTQFRSHLPHRPLNHHPHVRRDPPRRC